MEARSNGSQKSNFLTIDIVERIVFEYTRDRLTKSEPLPPFETRYPGKLEAALAAPQRTFDGKLLHQTLERQATILFYELNKQHAFVNGNKRMALVSLLVFLLLNDKWLSANPDDLYRLSTSVASSDVKLRDAVLEEIEKFIIQHLIQAVL